MEENFDGDYQEEDDSEMNLAMENIQRGDQMNDEHKMGYDGIENEDHEKAEMGISHVSDPDKDERVEGAKEGDNDSSLGEGKDRAYSKDQQKDNAAMDVEIDSDLEKNSEKGEKVSGVLDDDEEEVEDEENETLEELSQIKIKQAKSAWMLYMIANREKFKAENPTAKMAALTKIISDSWKALDEKGELGEAEKAPYIEEAEKEKSRYRMETEALKERIKKAQIRQQLSNNGTDSTYTKKIITPNFYQVNDSNIINQQSSAIPLAKLKKIIKLDDEVKHIAKDSVLLMDKALEYFVARLSYETARCSYPQRKSVKFDDLTGAIHRNEELQFLKGDINSKFLKSISSGTTGSKSGDANSNGIKSVNKTSKKEDKSIAKLSSFFNAKDKQ